jgi:hypothetical protein
MRGSLAGRLRSMRYASAHFSGRQPKLMQAISQRANRRTATQGGHGPNLHPRKRTYSPGGSVPAVRRAQRAYRNAARAND